MIARLAHIIRTRASEQERALGSIDGDCDDAISDAEVYAGREHYDDRALYDLMDEDNDCIHDGGHLYLTRCGETTCVHCGKRVT
jgi:hypothetical protein